MPRLWRVEHAARGEGARERVHALHGRSSRDGSENTAIALPEIPETLGTRLALQNRELNRVLGGGIVPGSAVLVGGDPGIGKSTLLLQMAAEVAQGGGKVLYVSAEESAHQIGRRARRLGIEADSLYVLSDIVVEQIVERVDQMRPALVIVDSIQAVYTENNTSAAGAVSQVRDSAALAIARGEGVQYSGLPGRPCDERRHDCRSSRAGAYGGRGAST